MKNIKEKLIGLLKEGYCTPQIARIAKKTKEPSSTIHYNIKQLEGTKTIRTYKAILDHSRIGEEFCAYILVNLAPDQYTNPESIAKEISNLPEIESVDIITGDWDLIIKVRTRNNDSFYQFIRNVLSKKRIAKMKSLITLKQVKSEFIKCE